MSTIYTVIHSWYGERMSKLPCYYAIAWSNDIGSIIDHDVQYQSLCQSIQNGKGYDGNKRCSHGSKIAFHCHSNKGCSLIQCADRRWSCCINGRRWFWGCRQAWHHHCLVSWPIQCISELHVGYMALHYPLLFLYGEDGWHPNILLNSVVLHDADADLDEDHAEEFEHHRKHHNVIMVEFYGYRLQHETLNGIALLWGDQLRQQYIVDAYAVIEQQLLRYLHLNQKKVSCRSQLRPSGCHRCRWQ